MALGSPLAAISLVDQAFEQLADAIAIGDLKPGERLREALLARRMGISRGVLREAVHRLEGRKLVRRTSNIGVHIVSLTEQDLKDMIEFYKTPLGKKIIENEPKAGEESTKRAQVWIDKYAADVVEKMRLEMKKRGHTEF